MAGGGLMARKQDPRRRDFLKKAAYSAPAVLTLQAVSGLAKAGSEKPDDGDEAEEEAEEDEDEAVEIDQAVSLGQRCDAVGIWMSERGVCY